MEKLEIDIENVKKSYSKVVRDLRNRIESGPEEDVILTDSRVVGCKSIIDLMKQSVFSKPTYMDKYGMLHYLLFIGFHGRRDIIEFLTVSVFATFWGSIEYTDSPRTCSNQWYST